MRPPADAAEPWSRYNYAQLAKLSRSSCHPHPQDRDLGGAVCVHVNDTGGVPPTSGAAEFARSSRQSASCLYLSRTTSSRCSPGHLWLTLARSSNPRISSLPPYANLVASEHPRRGRVRTATSRPHWPRVYAGTGTLTYSFSHHDSGTSRNGCPTSETDVDHFRYTAHVRLTLEKTYYGVAIYMGCSHFEWR